MGQSAPPGVVFTPGLKPLPPNLLRAPSLIVNAPGRFFVSPNGVQLKAIREHLRERPEVRRVWIGEKEKRTMRSTSDLPSTSRRLWANLSCALLAHATCSLQHAADYCCMPQKTETNTRSDTDKQTFQLMLKNVNLLFLGIGVLILTDRSYLSRFWSVRLIPSHMHSSTRDTQRAHARRCVPQDPVRGMACDAGRLCIGPSECACR